MFRFRPLKLSEHTDKLFVPRSETEWESTLYTATHIDHERLKGCRGLEREYPLIQKIVQIDPEMSITARVLPFVWNIGVPTVQGRECHKKSEWRIMAFFKYVSGEPNEECSIHTRSIHFHIKMLFASYSLSCLLKVADMINHPEFFKSRLLEDTKSVLLVAIATMEASRKQPWEQADPISVWPWLIQPVFVSSYINFLFALHYICVSIQKMNESNFKVAAVVGFRVVFLLSKADMSGVCESLETARKEILAWSELFLVELPLLTFFFDGRHGELEMPSGDALSGTKCMSCCMRIMEGLVKKHADDHVQVDVKMAIFHMWKSVPLSQILQVSDTEFENVLKDFKDASQNVGMDLMQKLNTNEIIRKKIFSEHVPDYDFIPKGFHLTFGIKKKKIRKFKKSQKE